jgi:UDP-N-acetylmuramyl pentapeptide synthase
VLVGAEFKEAAEQHEALYFDNSLDAGLWFKQQAFQGETILLKGSRGTALEKILST